MIGRHPAVLPHQPVTGEGRADKAEDAPCVPPENQERKGPELRLNLVRKVGIRPREVEIVKTFLLTAYPEARLVPGVKEQNRPQHRALPNALGTNQMHVAVQPHLPVADAGAVNEDNLT